MRTLIFIIVLISGLISSTILKAQLSDDASISIITCRAGDDIYNTFGHSAIRVQDPHLRLDVIYNYGIFNFQEEGFVGKFLRGKLKYWIGKSRMASFAEGYQEEKRTILEQRLNLSQEEKIKLYRALEDNYKPENRYYLYDFFFDNCSTRIRDILSDNISNLEYPKQTEKELTFRHLLDQHSYRSPWTDFGMDLLIGRITDNNSSVEEQMFLPEFLYQHLEATTVNNEPLVTSTSVLLDFEDIEKQRDHTPFFTPILFFGALLLLELVIFFWGLDSRWIAIYDKFWFALAGIGSLALTFMWIGTDHVTTKTNLNLLWMNPLFLFVLFKRSKKIETAILCLLAVAALQTAFYQSYHGAVYPIITILFLKIVRRIQKRKNVV